MLKMIFLKLKKINLMYFRMKIILKSIRIKFGIKTK
jgi:hypothetical protein